MVANILKRRGYRRFSILSRAIQSQEEKTKCASMMLKLVATYNRTTDRQENGISVCTVMCLKMNHGSNVRAHLNRSYNLLNSKWYVLR